MPISNIEPSSPFERAAERTREWIRKNVPAHTRHEYEDLLATNTSLAVKLIDKWRQLEDLQAEYHELQYQSAEAVAPFPSFKVEARTDYDQINMQQVHHMHWQVDPYRASFALSHHMPPHEAPRILRDAYRQAFNDKVMPALWERTEHTLFNHVKGAQRV